MIEEIPPQVHKISDSESFEECTSENKCSISTEVVVTDSQWFNSVEELYSQQDQIKQIQKGIRQKNNDMLKKLDFINATLEVKGKSKNEILGLEQVLVESNKGLKNSLLMSEIQQHIEQDHNFQYKNETDQASFYFYLLSKAFIYQGWEHFHCRKCLKYVRENSKSIWSKIQKHEELAQQINEIKYCCI